MKKFFCASLLCAILCLCGCGGKGESYTLHESVFNSFSAQSFDGSIVTEKVFAECKVTMVNVWATYCAPCIEEMPVLAELEREYSGCGFRVVGIAADGEKSYARAKEIVAETGADYIHLRPSADLKNFLSEITAVPYTVFVNESGCIIGDPYLGSKSGKDWKKTIKSMLDFVSGG